jgi:methylmalonyl-CoA mutase
VIRSTTEEKEAQIKTVQNLWERSGEKGRANIKNLQQKAIKNENFLKDLMEAVKYCSLGQITKCLV